MGLTQFDCGNVTAVGEFHLFEKSPVPDENATDPPGLKDPHRTFDIHSLLTQP